MAGRGANKGNSIASLCIGVLWTSRLSVPYLVLDAPRASGSGERQNLPFVLLRGLDLARTGNPVFDFGLYKIYGSIPICYAMRLSCTLHSFDIADTARE